MDTIMVGIEREKEARDAIALGVTLARAAGAAIILAEVYPAGPGPASSGYESAMRNAALEDVEAARELVPDDVSLSTRVIGSTSPVRGLHLLAEHAAADMIVVGPTMLSKSTRAVRGDVTLGLLHAAPCAVAVAPEDYAEPAFRRRVIGVAYVKSPEGEQALEAATQLASGSGSRLRIIAVAADPGLAFEEPLVPADLMESLRESTSRSLEEARAIVGARAKVETLRLDGDAASQLLRATGELDLLVMGSRGYGPVRRVLLGSVSSRIVHAASCPVIVLPRGARAPELA